MTEPTPRHPGGAGDPDPSAGPAQAESVQDRSAHEESAQERAEQGPVVRDRRRLDPQTGRVRQAYAEASAPAPAPASSGPGGDGVADAAPTGGDGPAGSGESELAAAEQLAAERLSDLQRLNAEYVNYRKRVERDREVVRDAAAASVLEALLPVLDDVHLARQHGDLAGGPFAAIADKLEATLTRFGLERYGDVGEPFDPTVHEALMHTTAELAEGTTATTVVQVLQPGYRAKERVLRAARVAVADPVGS